MALTDKNGSDALAPDLFHGGQNPQLVVQHNVMPGGMAAGYVGQFVFLVDIDHHTAIHSLEQPGAIHFARLENDIAIA